MYQFVQRAVNSWLEGKPLETPKEGRGCWLYSGHLKFLSLSVWLTIVKPYTFSFFCPCSTEDWTKCLVHGDNHLWFSHSPKLSILTPLPYSMFFLDCHPSAGGRNTHTHFFPWSSSLLREMPGICLFGLVLVGILFIDLFISDIGSCTYPTDLELPV